MAKITYNPKSYKHMWGKTLFNSLHEYAERVLKNIYGDDLLDMQVKFLVHTNDLEIYILKENVNSGVDLDIIHVYQAQPTDTKVWCKLRESSSKHSFLFSYLNIKHQPRFKHIPKEMFDVLWANYMNMPLNAKRYLLEVFHSFKSQERLSKQRLKMNQKKINSDLLNDVTRIQAPRELIIKQNQSSSQKALQRLKANARILNINSTYSI